jgi:pantothenate kinase-related protein Tda10
MKKEIINANGTWQSIQKWGKNEVLDDDQQTAFEILAATYVLMFSDQAIIDTTNSETLNAFNVRVKGLLQLARKSEDIEKPLCMFITGPAGAGKCK